MTGQSTILVPIRYPLTAQTTQTLAYAERLAHCQDGEDGRLLVLHVNMIHYNEQRRHHEIRRAIEPLLDRTQFTVSVRRGYLVEEAILDEALAEDVDVIVIGKNQTSLWRRLGRKITGNDPAIAPFLRTHLADETPVKVVG